jgi:uncharacterized protein YraI
MRLAILAAAAALAFAAAPASAYTTAFPASAINMRTGPDTDYPAVIVVPAGAPVTVLGCIGGWHWCDVTYGPYRGWVAGAYLRATWQQQPMPFYHAAPRYNVPIIAFHFGSYWDMHYRARPWYRHRDRWSRYEHGRRRR